MSLPTELFQVFLGLESEKKQLEFITKYRMGQAYLQKYLSRTLVGQKRSPAVNDAIVGRSFAGVMDRIIYLARKRKGGRVDFKRLVPLDLAPDKMVRMLKRGVRHRERRQLEKFSRLLNRVFREHLSGKIRGTWAVKKE